MSEKPVTHISYEDQGHKGRFVARIDGSAPPPGTAVHQAGESQAVGEVVDAVADGAGAIATIVLQLAARDAALSVEGSAAAVHILSGPPV